MRRMCLNAFALALAAAIFVVGCSNEDLVEQVATPVFTPNSGSGDYFDVSITTDTDGAEVRYTTDGSTPTSTAGAIYSGTIPAYRTMTVIAIAYADGMTDSEVATSGLFSIDPINTIIDSTGDVGERCSIAVDERDVYVAYYDASNGNLKFARSTDGGATWPETNITVVDAAGIVGDYPSMMVDGGTIYVSYYDATNGNLKFASSADGGATWPAINMVNVDTFGDVGAFSSLVVDGASVYICYHERSLYDLKFARSTDGGATWPSAEIQTLDSTGNVGYTSSMAVDGSNLYISYYDATNFDLKFARSADGGMTWPDILTIDSVGSVGVDSSIAVDGSNVYISYFDGTNVGLKFAMSSDGGLTWPPANFHMVDESGLVGYSTAIEVDGSSIFISYFDGTNFDLKFARSTDGGLSWPPGNIKTVDAVGDVGSSTSIAIDPGNVYISHYDFLNDDLKFAKSTDHGVTWE